MYNIAIVGATGAVGREFYKLLVKRNFPYKDIRLLASKRSAGKSVKIADTEYKVEELTYGSFADIDIAFFSAGAGLSKEYAPIAVDAGAVVIDNSSAFRNDPAVPLVIPECNANKIRQNKGIIANPNCSTIQLLVALNALHNAKQLVKIILSSYQAVSGSGNQAMQELATQIDQYNKGQALTNQIYPAPILNNLIAQIGDYTKNGYTQEEMKLVNETHKILDRPDIAVSATCVRVPVMRSHSEAVWATFKQPTSVLEARQILSSADGVELLDDSKKLAMPIESSGKFPVYISRLRQNLAEPNSITFWCVADQLLKGAALNGIQIAEEFIKVG